MIANMNEKGRQTKLLAAVAVFAMVVCALAVVMPSSDIDAANEIQVSPGENSDGVDNLQVAINNASEGDVLILAAGNYGDLSDTKYTKYIVNKTITIRAADSENKPVIYGGFAVNAEGCIFENLSINPDGEGATMKSGIALYGNTITVTGCDFDLGTANLANGIMLFPKTVTPAVKASYNISKNTFVGFHNDNTGGWGSTAIGVAEGYDSLQNYFDGEDDAVSGESGLTAADEQKFVDDNDFEQCTNVYDRTNYNN